MDDDEKLDEIEVKLDELEKAAGHMREVQDVKTLKELIWNDWYRFMSGAKDREERKRINKLFLTLTESINEIYAQLEKRTTGAKPEPWEELLRYLPPPLPIDPIGMTIYKKIVSSPKKTGSGKPCQLCAMMSLDDFIDNHICIDAKDPNRCAADFLKEIYFFVSGITKPEDFEKKLAKIFEKHGLDPQKIVEFKG